MVPKGSTDPDKGIEEVATQENFEKTSGTDREAVCNNTVTSVSEVKIKNSVLAKNREEKIRVEENRNLKRRNFNFRTVNKD